MREIWKDVAGYENLYSVSNMGRIKSLPRNTTSGRFLKLQDDGHGYEQCRLSKNGKVKAFKVHILVARNFIGPPPDGKCLDHVDNNRKNNKLENIEYVTYRENSIRGQRCNLNNNRSSIYAGVFKKKSGKFSAVKSYNGTQFNLGVFETEDEAKNAYEKMDKEDCIKQRESRMKSMSSKHIGVYYDKSRIKWVARIGKKYIGRFLTEEDAYSAVKNKNAES